ncbi:MAG: sensor histidine kinase [Gammaproteobacteria bacterium]|nr:MAG: sensor histidine kinase [Gammaproteobacteria bacterium]
MSDQQFGSMGGDPGPWLRARAAVLLDLAVDPLLDAPAARVALTELASVVGEVVADHSPALRERLVAAAERLLDSPEPAAVFEKVELHRLGLEATRRLVELLKVVDSQFVLARIEAAWLPEQAEPADPLVRDIRRYQDAPADLLADAHIVVRLAAAARLLARRGPEALAAVSAILGLDEHTLVMRFEDLQFMAPPATDGGPLEDLLRLRIQRFRDVARALLPLADMEDPATALARLEQIASELLGSPVLPVWVERDGVLALHGSSDLAGQQLSTRQDASLAATVLASGALGERDTETYGTPIIDCQCADRVESRTLLAIPILVPEPVAVLLTSDAVDRRDFALVAVHAARWMERIHRFEERLLHTARNYRNAQERRLREIVHEASNPLSVIHNYLHLLGARLDDESAGKEQLGLIGDEIRRTGEILRSLVESPAAASEREAASATGITDVNQLVAEVVELLEPTLTEAAGIEVRMVQSPELGAIPVDGQRLRQVVLNLVKNAVEAMTDGGTLEVVVDAGVASVGGGRVEIRVTDSGPGIPPDLLERVFEAGVSVKGSGRGLGLSIVKRLVEELGGSVFCRSKPGAGTSFVVLLPRH